MLIADIRGKLTRSEYVSEDFLTSSVFSSLKYLPREWLEKFLRSCMNMKGSGFEYHTKSPVFLFWKWYKLSEAYGNGAIPDVIILDDNLAVIIECKFTASKGGSGTDEDGSGVEVRREPSRTMLSDQLAREYFVGKKALVDKQHRVNGHTRRIDDFVLIYLTDETFFPSADIEESLDEIERIEPGEYENAVSRIFWTNWESLVPILHEIRRVKDSSRFEHDLSHDLLLFLERRGITRFGGFDSISSPDLLDNLDWDVRWFGAGSPSLWSRLGYDLLGNEEFKGFFRKKQKQFWSFRLPQMNELSYVPFLKEKRR
ncbi:MAG: hypothetical protein KAW09_08115 [Thermoplasmata archaeon]|nr:hypothetical protein [Thermoplasmata archaeon]